MKIANDSPWAHLIRWVRLYYAIHFLESGLNFALFGFIPDFSKAGLAGPFQIEMATIGLYQIVKYLEVVLGAMLLVNFAVPFALIPMAAISFIIIYLNLIVSPDPRQAFSGMQEMLLIGSLLLAYGGYYADFCRARTRPYWLWDGFSGRGRPVPPPPGQGPVALADTVARWRDYLLVAGFALLATAAVMIFSTRFGQRPLRLYDYGPPLGAAFLAMAIMACKRRSAT
jgi:putative oxidoreductase